MKLHFVNLHEDGVEHSLPLNTLEDFKHAAEVFPQLHETLYRHRDLRQTAKEMAEYLSSHHMKAWISEE